MSGSYGDDGRDGCLDATADRMPVDPAPPGPPRRRHDVARARAVRAGFAVVVAGLAVLVVVAAVLRSG